MVNVVETQPDVAKARRRRWRGFVVQFALFLLYQTIQIHRAARHAADSNAVGPEDFFGSICMCIVAALLLSKRRPLAGAFTSLEDQHTEANRSAALRTGYWALLSLSMAMYGIALFMPSRAAVAWPVVVTLGIAVPVVTFLLRERLQMATPPPRLASK
jgi:hypothetical protein